MMQHYRAPLIDIGYFGAPEDVPWLRALTHQEQDVKLAKIALTIRMSLRQIAWRDSYRRLRAD